MSDPASSVPHGITSSHIAELRPDPGNARKHTPRNIGMIANALNEVGAARSIVIDEDNRILAGNATVEAAAEAGIERVQIVDADGDTLIAVRRRNLTRTQKLRLALYDNRTTELSEWDETVLRDLAEDGLDFSAFFYEDELTKLLSQDDQALTASSTSHGDGSIVVTCPACGHMFSTDRSTNH